MGKTVKGFFKSVKPYFLDPNLTVYNADVLAGLARLADKSVHCAITSPPYWGLRNYKIPPTAWPAVEFIPVAGLPPYTVPAMSSVFGLEPDPWSYVAHSVHVFRQLRRALRDDGTLWLNLGDSYAGSGGSTGHTPETKNLGRKTFEYGAYPSSAMKSITGLKPKDLVGIPWMVAKALQADGWYLRMDCIWAKKNCMPESVNDRPTKAHEYIFLLSKSQRYYYDAEAVKEASGDWHNSDFHDGKNAEVHPSVGKNRPSRKRGEFNGKTNTMPGREAFRAITSSRNLRSVWHMATQPYPESHFATFPGQLPEICIKAGTSEKGVCAACGAPWQRVVEKTFEPQKDVSIARGVKGAPGQKPMDQSSGWEGVPRGTTAGTTTGWIPSCACNAPVIPAIVLDPFAGSGTTNAKAEELGRRSIAIETKGEYCKLILKRCHQQQII